MRTRFTAQGLRRHVWRLFHQRRDPSAPPPLAHEVGFTGDAAHLPIEDDHFLGRLRATASGRRRMEVAYGHLKKILKHANGAADKLGDQSVLEELDAQCSDLAEQILLTIHDLRNELRARGYDVPIATSPYRSD
jgi:hypothetical protein